MTQQNRIIRTSRDNYTGPEIRATRTDGAAGGPQQRYIVHGPGLRQTNTGDNERSEEDQEVL